LPETRRPALRHSIYFIVLIALLLRLAVITIGHTYRITPRGDHFQFAWEVGRIARSIATGQGFSSPTDLPSGPTAWMPPVYTYILAGVFKLFGVYSATSAWVILAFNSVFAALTCLTIYRIGEKIYGTSVARAAAWTWAVFPYLIYWPVRVVYDTSFSAFLLSLSLLMTLKIADAFRTHSWVVFGLLWGLIILTNPSLTTMLACSLLWLLYRAQRPRSWLRERARPFVGGILQGPLRQPAARTLHVQQRRVGRVLDARRASRQRSPGHGKIPRTGGDSLHG
jgi:4-amino-4-deoxy-L-arabinose transferase-like glycosyltransferase